MAAIKNVAQVALDSPAMIFRNYRELVTPQDAEAWFAIEPEKAKKVKVPGRSGKSGKKRA